MRNVELRERIKALTDKYDTNQTLDQDESWQLQQLLIISLEHGYLPIFGARGGISYRWVGGGHAYQDNIDALKETGKKRFSKLVQKVEVSA